MVGDRVTDGKGDERAILPEVVVSVAGPGVPIRSGRSHEIGGAVSGEGFLDQNLRTAAGAGGEVPNVVGQDPLERLWGDISIHDRIGTDLHGVVFLRLQAQGGADRFRHGCHLVFRVLA